MKRLARPWILLLALSVAVGGSIDAQEREMSLDEALSIALERNLELVQARFTPQEAEQDVELAKAGFDPSVLALYNRAERDDATASAEQVSKSESDFIRAQVEQPLLKWGGNARAYMDFSRTAQTGGFSFFPTFFRSNLTFEFNLPILRGFGVETNTETLVLAKNRVGVTRVELEGDAESVIERTEGAYWDLVAAREALRIAELSLERAEDLLELNRKQVEVGTMAPIEITQAEAGVAAQEEGVILAEVGIADAEDALRGFLAIPAGDPLWSQTILPTDQPDQRREQIDLGGAISTALETRAEMISSRQAIRNAELTERVAKRQTKSQLDFDAGYTLQGQSGTLIDAGPDLIPGTSDDFRLTSAEFSSAFSDMWENENYNWNAGFTYRIPIGNRLAKAEYRKASIARERAEVTLATQEQSIRIEVRRAVRAVESGVKRIDAASKNVELQEETLRAEQKKFENGIVTSFEVLQIQENLAEAELARVRAGLDYAKALTALERVKGTLLEARGLRIGS